MNALRHAWTGATSGSFFGAAPSFGAACVDMMP